MSGSGSSPPNVQGLGITSHSGSDRVTPSNGSGNPFSGGVGPAIHNPRVRGQLNPNMLHQQQMQQQQMQRQQQQQQQQQQHQQHHIQHHHQQQQARNQQMQMQQAGPSNQDSFSFELQGMSVDPSLQHLLSTGEVANPTAYRMQQGMPHPFPPQIEADTQAEDTEEQQQQEDDPYETNTFCLKVNSPLTIMGDNNIVTFHPAPQVQNIAEAVLKALVATSEGQRGLPMGDAEGNPRGIRLDITAAVSINGHQNIVGEEAVKAWSMKVKGEALAAQAQAQRVLQLQTQQLHANANAKAQAAAQAKNPTPYAPTPAQTQTQTQAQAHGQTQAHQSPPQAIAIDAATQAQIQQFQARRQSQSMALAQTQAAQAQLQQQQQQARQAHQAQLQANAQQQQQQQHMKLAASAPKDGKRAREVSGCTSGDEANKKSRVDG
ncbi:hypothetical protein MFRU_040g00620 [Monilinia fructicola]|nr:hypothetical protein MFRU_040g00620 [Monilinia fructicola]